MIRSITIVENMKDDGTVEYTANGSLPIDEAAKVLVVIAYQTVPMKKEDGLVEPEEG